MAPALRTALRAESYPDFRCLTKMMIRTIRARMPRVYRSHGGMPADYHGGGRPGKAAASSGARIRINL